MWNNRTKEHSTFSVLAPFWPSRPFIYWKWYGSPLLLLWISDKKKYKHFRGISIPTEFCSNWPDGFEYNDKCKEMTIAHKILCIRSAKNPHFFYSLHVHKKKKTKKTTISMNMSVNQKLQNCNQRKIIYYH
jgi:hypothetical protein